jgi:6-phosphogluconolactonase
MTVELHLAGLRGEQSVNRTAIEASHRLASDLALHLQSRLAIVPLVHLALSGGSSAQLLFGALAERMSSSAWARIHIWLVDERCVPDHDPRLNFSLIRDTLISKVPLPQTNLHPMPVLQVDGALSYEREITAALAARQKDDQRLDAVVLGMGPDGHTASLFPHTPALEEHDRLIVLNDGDSVAQPRPRMTMTYSLLGHSRLIALLVTGQSKQKALFRVAVNPTEYRSLPVAGVLPAEGSLMRWYLDEAVLRPCS